MKNNTYKKALMSVVAICLVSISTLSATGMNHTRNIYLNDKLIIRNEELLLIEGEVLVPLNILATRMGATEVEWCPNKATLRVENPTFLENRLYLSYLAGLGFAQQSKEDVHYPLPKRLQTIALPTYPLKSLDTPVLEEQPITLNIIDQGYMMPYAVYDYQVRGEQVYIGSDWLNAIFLANIVDDGKNYYINFPTEEMLTERLDNLQNEVRAKTPEEAVALWLNGQQTRSGALQFAILAPELQEKVLAKEEGWVTGFSSPSIGKASIQKAEKRKDGSISYTILLEEVLQGEVQDTLKQKLTVACYQKGNENYWHITQAKGDLDYSIL